MKDFADFAKNADKYGFCTYEQFKKNPDKWRPNRNQLLTSVDNGAQEGSLKNKIESTRYYLEGYRCEKLEKVEDLAREMNIKTEDLKIGGIVQEKADNGKVRLHVHFMSQQTIDKRKTW